MVCPLFFRYSWIKNGKHFDWQAYDDRISQQPGRGTLVISSPRDEDLGIFLIYCILFIICIINLLVIYY